jgi:hypothetical protein
MSFHRFAVFVLALATAGAQVVCACAMPGAPKAEPMVEKSCAGEGECCQKKALAAEVPVQKTDPCGQCNLKHRTDQAKPESASVVASPQLVIHVLAVPVLFTPGSDVAFAPNRASEAVPLPPLLRDLFHVHSLLLN